jgi:hypothetical protein
MSTLPNRHLIDDSSRICRAHSPALVGSPKDYALLSKDCRCLATIFFISLSVTPPRQLSFCDDKPLSRPSVECHALFASPVVALVDPGNRRVVRVGSWDLNPRVVRAADRVRDATGLRIYILGFRLARTLNP